MSEAFQEAMKERKILDASQKPKKKTEYEKALTPSENLLDGHLQDWIKSGIPKEIVSEIDVRSSLNSDSWLTPILDIDKKKLLGHRARYNNEVIEANKYPSRDDETPKYRPSKGLRNTFFYPHINEKNWEKISQDIKIAVGFTEGEKKAVKVTIEGLPTIGLFGVNNWVYKKEDSETSEEKSEPIEDFKLFKWKNRMVYLIFDSDKFKNKRVLEAEGKLWAYLTSLGAKCKVINLPEDPEAKGIDDFFVKHEVHLMHNKLKELISQATNGSLGYLIVASKSKKLRSEIPHCLAEFICQTEAIKNTSSGLYIYKDGFYQQLPEQELKQKIIGYLKITCIVPTSHILNETVKILEAVSFTANQDINPELMHNVSNGILKLNPETKEIEFIKHSPEYFFNYIAEAEYLQETTLAPIQTFIDTVIQDKNQQKLILEALAFSTFPGLRNYIEYTKMTLMYGDGKNGKSIFTRFSKEAIGYSACSSTSLDQLLNKENRFTASTLSKKRANFSTENETVFIKDSSTLKAITSGKPGDELLIEFKHKQAFSELIRPILFFAINKPPALPASRTFAIERRVQVVNFPVRFSKNPKSGELKADDRFENKEFIKPYVNGLLILVLKTAKELLVRGSLTEEGIEQNLEEAILKGSHLERFAKEHLVFDLEAETTTQAIYEEYLNFCYQEGIAYEHQSKNGTVRTSWQDEKSDPACRSTIKLGRWINARFKYQVKNKNISLSEGKQAKGFKGINLRKNIMEDHPSIRIGSENTDLNIVTDTNNSNTDNGRINSSQNAEQYSSQKRLVEQTDGCTDSSPVISQKEPKQELLEKVKELKDSATKSNKS